MPTKIERYCKYCGKPFLVAPCVIKKGWGKYCSKSCSSRGGNPRRVIDAKLFWSKVDKSAGADECWPWRGNIGYGGYGRFGYRSKKTHRVAYELTYGPFSSELFVLHKCDNPICCNPLHLFLGTHQDNMNDAKAKGRMHNGEADGNSKLTEEQVIEIRRLYSDGMSQAKIGRQLGISPQTIYKICHRERWAHVK